MRAAEMWGGRVPGEGMNDARTPLADFFSILFVEVVTENQERKAEGGRTAGGTAATAVRWIQ